MSGVNETKVGANAEAGELPGPRSAPHWVDRVVGADPGFSRLRSAAMSVTSIGLILAAEGLFVHFSHALQIPGGAALPAAAAAKVAAANHEFLVVLMLIGSMVGMASSLGVSDAKAKDQFVTLLIVPIPLVAMLSFGLAVGGNRALSLALLPIITAVGTYLRRFGPRGMFTGMLMFFGFFLGFFLSKAVTVDDLGWLTAAVGIGLVVTIAVRFLLFFPDEKKALVRMEHSFVARAQVVAREALDLFDESGTDAGAERRLGERLRALNEVALMIDAQLGDPDAVAHDVSRAQLHQRLFDLELALTNVVRFTEALAARALESGARSEVRLALIAIEERNALDAKRHAEALDRLLERESSSASDGEDTTVVLLHRFAGSIETLADAVAQWSSIGSTPEGPEEFTPAVHLFGGWLPGSAGVSSAAAAESSDRPGERIPLMPWSRLAIQIGIALAAATVLGDVISPSRYYWAVIAVFTTFMGANTSGEQSTRAVLRVAGTAIGIVVGSLAVDAVGRHVGWSLALILVTLFLGFYLIRVNYTFFVIALTVVLSQLYQELNEFSDTLLLYRLAETALGAVIAIAVVTLVLPLRTRRVLRVAFRNHIRAIETLVVDANTALTADGTDRTAEALRNDARAIDASYQVLVTTARPLGRGFFGGVDEGMSQVVRLASVSRNYCRDLVSDLSSARHLDPGPHDELNRAATALEHSLSIVADAMSGPRNVAYVRSSSLYDRAERALGEGALGPEARSPVIRDFKLIDESMATLAEVIGLAVTDLDTSVATG